MPQDNFTLLRTILRALGLSPEAIDDIVSRTLDLLGARADRQERDDFVGHVFAAAKLPLVRLPVRRAYPVAEFRALLRQQAGLEDRVVPARGDPPAQQRQPAPAVAPAGVAAAVATATSPDPALGAAAAAVQPRRAMHQWSFARRAAARARAANSGAARIIRAAEAC